MENNSFEDLKKINPERIGDYLLYKEIGKGSYGVVYLAKHKDDPKNNYALKRYFLNLHPNIVILEILILKYLKHLIINYSSHTDDTILKIVDGSVDNYEMLFISTFKKNLNFNSFFKTFSFDQIKIYMYKLLRCLESIHKLGIVHRDIKPTNFLYNPEDNSCLLIDFGLAECIYEEIKMVPESLRNDKTLQEIIKFQNNIGFGKGRIGTRGFLPPEIIFQSKNQTSDIWAAGVILLGFLTQRMPVLNLNKFSKVTDDVLKELIPLIIIFGKEKMIEVAKSYDIVLYISNQMECLNNSGGLNSLFKKQNIDYQTVDFLYTLLELDPNKRSSASQALNHPYFDILRRHSL